MRRAFFLLTLLTAPALASAQAAGEVTFANGRTFPMYVNATECQGGTTVTARWTPALLNNNTSVPAGGTYAIYASDASPVNNLCFIQDTTTNNGNTTVHAGQVPDLDATPAGNSGVINLGTLLQKAGKSCANDLEILYICVQGIVGGVNNAATNFAFAVATVTISTAPPPPPIITGVSPGDSALNLSWEPGVSTTSASGDTQEYVLEATAVGSTAAQDPVPVHTSSRATGTSLRFGGLVNNVEYSVRAFAFSKADNMSAASDAVNGTPLPVNDFWETYKNAGGRDSGGCSSGFAGPLGLGILLATLALVRRRK